MTRSPQAAALLALAMIAGALGQDCPKPPLSKALVSAAWLGAHRADPGLIILPIGAASGALPSKARIVLYASRAPVYELSRAWAVMDAMGLGNRASILDGALPGWVPAGAAQPQPSDGDQRAGARIQAPSAFPGCSQTLASLPDVVAAMHGHDQILVDARPRAFYTGLQTVAGERAGHIPGATNLPYTELLNHGRFRPVAEWPGIFRLHGIGQRGTIIVYCHSGRKASVVYFAARALGLRVRLYRGSWEEWSEHAALPTATGPR